MCFMFCTFVHSNKKGWLSFKWDDILVEILPLPNELIDIIFAWMMMKNFCSSLLSSTFGFCINSIDFDRGTFISNPRNKSRQLSTAYSKLSRKGIGEGLVSAALLFLVILGATMSIFPNTEGSQSLFIGGWEPSWSLPKTPCTEPCITK